MVRIVLSPLAKTLIVSAFLLLLIWGTAPSATHADLS